MDFILGAHALCMVTPKEQVNPEMSTYPKSWVDGRLFPECLAPLGVTMGCYRTLFFTLENTYDSEACKKS
jgi:hypothetical protein